MANDTPDDEVIEKRPSHPVSTACLILAAAAIIGGLAFQVAEISEVRATKPVDRTSADPYSKVYNKNKTDFEDAVKKVIAENDHPEILRSGSEGAAGSAPEGAGAGDGGRSASETPPPPAREDAKEDEAPPAQEEPADASAEEPAKDESAEEPAKDEGGSE